ncbi:tetratricopeptide repeat protein [uncultured Duncaniella sp.]|uniref:tetratricopeptide repeat protein n=1 Tax=uncultured Duncaniella sp. TaxID=2768039 RepID=UPI0025A932B4|nr:tetratricopeptide repeat protein [uncultured Duncaniella sp.]
MGIFRILLVVKFLLVIVILQGCTNHTDSDLLTAQSLMIEHPDSALIILENLDIPNNESDGYKAKYGLLLTQARYKNFIDEECDSLIKSSAEYFLRNNEMQDAGMSLFLLGMIQNNMGKMGESAVSLTQGIDLSVKYNLFEIEGLCAKGLYLLYVQLYDGAKQIKYAKESYEAFVKGGYDEWANYAKLDVAIAYNNSGKYSKAILEATQVIQIAEEVKDTLLLAEAIRLIGLSEFALGNSKEAIYYYSQANSLDKSVLTDNDKSNLIIAISEINTDTISVDIRNLISEINIKDESYTPFEIYASRGEYEEAYKSLELYKKEQDRVLSSLLRSNVSDALQNYEHSKKELLQEKIKNERLLWFLIVLIVLIIGLVIIYLLRKNLQEKERQQEEIIEKAECLKTDLLYQIEANSLISGSVKELFRQKYSIVNTLCAAYYESEGVKLEKKRIVSEVEQIVYEFSNDSNRMDEIKEYADKYTNGIYSAFKEDFPKSKEEDYRLFLYLMMGFGARSISLFLGEKIEVVYNRKSRLKARIKNSDVSRKKDYLLYCDVSV